MTLRIVSVSWIVIGETVFGTVTKTVDAAAQVPLVPLDSERAG
jgi:hypothetical protein